MSFYGSKSPSGDEAVARVEPNSTSGPANPFSHGATTRQTALLAAVAFAAERFLKTSDWRQCMDEVLAKLGSATDVSRVYIFEDHLNSQSIPCTSQTYEWVNDGIEPQIDSPELQCVPLTRKSLVPFRDPLVNGDAHAARVRDLPDDTREVLEAQNIVSFAVVPIINRNTIVGFVGFDDCVHERVWLEVELDALKAASGILGAAMQRTADEVHLRHKEEQLRQAQKMEAVGNLAGGIAHDFNNVLQVIWFSSESLRSKLPPESPLHNDIKTIGDAVIRASALPNQLLAFARRQVVQPRLQNLDKSVSEILHLVRRVISEDVVFETVRSDQRILVKVDPVQLQQAVMNLMLNARDAMPRGGLIRVRTSKVHVDSELVSRHANIPPGDYALVEVDDDGTGMDEETLDRLFEPFYTTKKRGNGIGLATVYGIVKQNNGHITVSSKPGVGSRFQMYFPLHDDVDARPSLPSEPDVKPHGSESVLVVEDEEPLRCALKTRLESFGYHVLVAPDGPSALAMDDLQIDMLLTDVVMPKMDGTQLALRLLARIPNLKVLYMSGHAFDVIERCGIDPNALTILRKPFSATELAKQVRAALDGKSD